MTQITIDIQDKEIDKQVEMHKILNALPNKAMAVEDILRQYFKENPLRVNFSR